MSAPRILVWDLPTRAFHWLLALCFAGAVATGESGQLHGVHVALGYTMLGLVAFRLAWGVVGTRYARFRSFAFGPRKVLAYFKSLATMSPQHHVGHNPAGSWAIWALLSLVVLATATGYATNEGLGGDWLEGLHEGVVHALLALVALHVAAVVASSLLHRENLARAMLDGYKRGAPGEGIRARHAAVAFALVLSVAAFWVAGTDAPSLPWPSEAHADTSGRG
jgi:cytochrome b